MRISFSSVMVGLAIRSFDLPFWPRDRLGGARAIHAFCGVEHRPSPHTGLATTGNEVGAGAAVNGLDAPLRGVLPVFEILQAMYGINTKTDYLAFKHQQVKITMHGSAQAQLMCLIFLSSYRWPMAPMFRGRWGVVVIPSMPRESLYALMSAAMCTLWQSVIRKAGGRPEPLGC